MADLSGVPWPPEAMATERLVLRAAQTSDRPAFVDLFCSEKVRAYLGGACNRSEVEREMPATPGNRPGVFVVEHRQSMIGLVVLDRRDAERPGHVTAGATEVELSYEFLPEAWGNGYALEAALRVLEWADGALSGEPIVLCTQTANLASMRLAARLGFQEAARFIEFDAEQWFGVRVSGRGMTVL